MALPLSCKAKEESAGPGAMAGLSPEQLKQVDLVEIADQHSPVDVSPEQLRRLKLMNFLGPTVSLSILPVRIRGKEQDAAIAGDLAEMINAAGLCKAAPAKQSLLLKSSLDDPNEMNKLLAMANEFRDYVKKNPPDTDYVLYVDYVFFPQNWVLFMLHFVVCDRQGEWVIVDMQNSDHPDFQSIVPASKEDSNKLLVKRLKSYLGKATRGNTTAGEQQSQENASSSKVQIATDEKSEPKGSDVLTADNSRAGQDGPKAGEERTFADIKFCWCPPGEFMMGSEDGGDDEKPVHRVRLAQGFWLGKYEVTNAQFRRFQPDHDSGSYEGQSMNGDEQPVAKVSWDEAQSYIAWLNKKGEGTFRLPSEAQWEYTCRAGTTTVRYWGNDETSMGQYANGPDKTAKSQWHGWTVLETTDGYKATAPVGSFKPNGFGLYDMIGNVGEWCQDVKRGSYEGAPTDGSAWEGKATAGQPRVVRGGSWAPEPSHCRAAARLSYPSFHGLGTDLGFRLLRTP
jgi:formylglycine-generating enzyme required for sulfatase activity